MNTATFSDVMRSEGVKDAFEGAEAIALERESGEAVRAAHEERSYRPIFPTETLRDLFGSMRKQAFVLTNDPDAYERAYDRMTPRELDRLYTTIFNASSDPGKSWLVMALSKES